jgi:hypothetical protein
MRRKFILMACLAVLFISSLTTSKPVYAMSSGCADINANGYTQIDLDLIGTYVLEAGDMLIVTQSSDPSTENQPYVIQDTLASVVLAGPQTGNGSISWEVPADGTYNLQLGYPTGNHMIVSTAVCISGGAFIGAKVRTITSWGVDATRAVVWQWQDSSDRWWWLTVPNTDKKLETPIEYRDRVGSNGEPVPNYPMSRITGGRYALPDDPAKFRVFNADTLEELHGVWIEIGNEGSLDRLSVFIP